MEMKILFFLSSLFLLLPACDSREPSVMVYTWPGSGDDAVVALPQDKVREYINSCDIILRVTCEDEFDLSPDIETKLTRRYRVQSVVKGDVAPGDIPLGRVLFGIYPAGDTGEVRHRASTASLQKV